MARIKDLLLSLEEVEVNAKRTLESVARCKASFATSEEDWNNYRDEELARDAAEEERSKSTPEPQAVSLDDVRAKLADYSREGKTTEVKKLLARYGAERLSAINPKDYAALLAEAEAMFHA